MSSGAVETAVCCINSTNITLAASVVQVQCTEFLCTEDVHNTNSTSTMLILYSPLPCGRKQRHDGKEFFRTGKGGNHER